MGASTQFDRVSAWLRRQQRSVERVNLGQASAHDLVSTAEYELSRLREELDGIMLDRPQAERPSTMRFDAPGDESALSAGGTHSAPEGTSTLQDNMAPRTRVSREPVGGARGREKRTLAARLLDVSDDAA